MYLLGSAERRLTDQEPHLLPWEADIGEMTGLWPGTSSSVLLPLT